MPVLGLGRYLRPRSGDDEEPEGEAHHGDARRDDEDALERAALLLITGRSDRKSTRLNSSHLGISYAVFCLKKNHGSPLRAPFSVSPFSRRKAPVGATHGSPPGWVVVRDHLNGPQVLRRPRRLRHLPRRDQL